MLDLRQPCEACGGEKVVNRDYWTQDADDCPSCQDDQGNPTGLKWPMLVRKCPSVRCTEPQSCHACGDEHCSTCHGTGYIPKPENDRIVAMMEWLQDKWYRFSVVKNDPLGWVIRADNFYEELSKCKYRQGIGPTLCAALAAACEAVAEVK